ncbi:MAG TPA: helix-turn-helix domain-containing protein [bacterium]|nr:helix-turn-helix domain-containing protein [bacterium]
MREMLISWEEIAGYLRISRKTAQRMEKSSELPVRRKGRGFVYAFKDEVDTWLNRPPQQLSNTE